MSSLDKQPPQRIEATIGICTRDRPDEVQTLLRSIGASRFGTGERPAIEIVIVENGPTRAGFDVDELERLAGWPVTLVHEPRPGVSYARNAVVHNRGDAPLLIMVDDDEFVTRSWLASHLAYAADSDADVITGPVLTVIPDDAPEWAQVVWRNVPRWPTGSERPSFLGGNVCFRTHIFDDLDEWFDERRPLATADDAAFGRRLVELGYRIVWNDGAIAWEPVHQARLTHRWMLRRYLSFGGFESQHSIDRLGRLGAFRAGIGTTLSMIGRGIGAAFRSHRPEQHAAAIALLGEATGWVLGFVGYRVNDYRKVTSK